MGVAIGVADDRGGAAHKGHTTSDLHVPLSG